MTSNWRLPSRAGPSTSTYSRSGPNDTARLAGSVHGVVVQIGTATIVASSISTPNFAASTLGSIAS